MRKETAVDVLTSIGNERTRKIFHLHIPKTGGQTLSSQIAAAVPEHLSYCMQQDLVFPGDRDRFQKLIDQYEFISAHVRGPLLQSNNTEIDILCAVRNPVDCIVSSYQHIRLEPTNLLYRPALELSPENFMERFRDWFTDAQSTAFVNSFVPFGPRDQIHGRGQWVDQYLDQCISRCRWLIPTENITEFSTLFAIEKRIPIIERPPINVAAGTDPTAAQLRDYLRRHPDIWARDLLFWTKAQRSFKRYKKELVDSFSDEVQGVFSLNGDKIILRQGWHSPQRITDRGIFWASGPENVSSIHYKREASSCSLCFNVAVYTWVSAEQILIVDACGRALRSKNDGMQWTIDLSDQPLTGDIFLLFPNTFCSMQFVDGSKDLRRTAIVVDKFWMSKGPM